MFFIFKYFLRGSKRHSAKSNNILASFTKTKTQLTELNVTIQMGIEANQKKAIKLAKENDALNKMRQSHDRIITNIDSFLDV